MDDQLSIQSPIVEPYELDAVTEELRAEFARLGLNEITSDANQDEWIDPSFDALRISARELERSINSCIERAFLALESIERAYYVYGPSPILNRQYKFWIGVLAFFLAALAQLKTLLARSQRAILRVPLFLDGPELSEYKHRLR